MNIIQIEKERNQIAELLTSSVSPSYRLKVLVSFLQKYKTQAGMDNMRSFFLEFSSPLFQLINESTLKYSDPLYLNSVLDILNVFPEHLSKKFSLEKLTHCQNLVREQLIQTWLIAGEWEKIFPFLETITEETVGPAIKKQIREELSGITDPVDHIQQICFILKEKKDNSARILEKIADTWEQDFRQTYPDRMYLLLAEKNGLQGFTSDHALLLPVHLSVRMRPRDNEEDIIKFNNDLVASQGPVYHSIADCITSVRLYAAHNLPASVTRSYFTFQFSIPEKGALYTGDSWGASLALLAYCGLVNTYYKQQIAALHGSAVITGALDSRGQLKPVTEDSLPAKIKTAFFSPLKRLIVPMQNMTAALDCFKKLQQEYPHRHLQLESAEHLGQLLDDKNLIQMKRLTMARQMVTRVRRHQKSISWVLSGLVVILLFLILITKGVLWKDNNPATVDIVGEYLVVKNVQEQELWRHDFGIPLTRSHYKGVHQNTIMKDINQDGINELVCGIYTNNHPEKSGHLILFDKQGNIVWDRKTGQEMTFGKKKYSDHYRIAFVDAVDLNNNGHKEIISLSHQFPDFPCCLNIWNEKGEKLGEYWHAGQFEQVNYIDIDGDGVKELFALGQNNEYCCAVLAVLEPFEMQGASPQTVGSKYYTDTVPPGNELYYIRFPQSDIHFLLGANDQCYQIIDEGERLQLAIGNSHVTETRSKFWNINILYYFLGRDLSCKEITISNQYKYKVYQLTGKKIDEQSLKNRLQNLLYYDGEKWVNTPTKTKNWREK
ncbi:MAG: hypothetical protein R6V04_04460 [bacterium]